MVQSSLSPHQAHSHQIKQSRSHDDHRPGQGGQGEHNYHPYLCHICFKSLALFVSPYISVFESAYVPVSLPLSLVFSICVCNTVTYNTITCLYGRSICLYRSQHLFLPFMSLVCLLSSCLCVFVNEYF